MPLSYLCEPNWEGLLTAVFEAFARKQQPNRVLPDDGSVQLMFGEQTVQIQTDPAKALRVERGVMRHMGSEALSDASTAYLAADPDRYTLIWRYIRTGMSIGRGVYTHLTHKDILPVRELHQKVGREAHLFLEFTRFSLLKNDVWFSRISPIHCIVPLIMPHFADRFTDQNFLIYDDVHNMAGLYDQSGWRMIETTTLNLPELADGEVETRRLWKLFYNTIAIEERINPVCRRTHMPKRFWRNMTEFRPDHAV